MMFTNLSVGLIAPVQSEHVREHSRWLSIFLFIRCVRARDEPAHVRTIVKHDLIVGERNVHGVPKDLGRFDKEPSRVLAKHDPRHRVQQLNASNNLDGWVGLLWGLARKETNTHMTYKCHIRQTYMYNVIKRNV